MKNIILTFAFLIVSTGLLAQSNPTLNIQGVLRDSDNRAVSDGTYDIEFRLYEEKTGGAEIWSEDQSVNITNGVYSSVLGEISSMENLGFSTQYYLALEVEGGSELSPRIPLSLSPYSKAVIGENNVFPSTGTVGIGTTQTSDDATLHVSGGRLLVENGNIFLDNSNLELNGNYISGDGDNEGVFVSTNGDVGIGTNNPAQELEVKGIAKFDRIQSDHSDDNVDVWIQGGSSTSAGDSRNLALIGRTDTDILFLNPANEYKGGVGIFGKTTGLGGFVTSGISTLDISGSGRGRWLVENGERVNNDNQLSGYKFSGDNDTGMFTYRDGRISFFSNGKEVMIIDATLGVTCGAFTGFEGRNTDCGLDDRNTFSDERIKTNIKSYQNENALSNILMLKPATFAFNLYENSPTTYGLIAQEVEKHIPNAVQNSGQDKTLSDGTVVENVKALDYDMITLELIMAVQELAAKVERLSSENETLKKRLAAISGYVTSSQVAGSNPDK